MEFHQLEYVLAVAKYGGFTRAAEEIKTSQSSLSQQICKLEQELGISLFTRSTRTVQITPAGARFLPYAQRIMAEAADARNSINEYVSTVTGPLLLGVLPVVGYYPLPKLLSSFQNRFPEVALSLREEQCSDLLRLLHETKIDAALVQHYQSNPHFVLHHLLDDQMVVVVSTHHPLACREAVSLVELQTEKFIIPPPSSGHYHDFHEACLATGFVPKVPITCSSVRTLLSLVREGMGITVLSSAVALLDYVPGLKILTLTPPIPRNISLAIRRNADFTPPLKAFVKFTSQWIDTHLVYAQGLETAPAQANV